MADSQRFLDTSIVKEARSPWEVYRKGKVHIYKRPACQSKEFWGNRGQIFIIGLMIAASNDSSNALTKCLLCARYDVGHCTCPIQFNTQLNSGSGMFLWCPSFRWGNWGSEDWKDFVQSLNDTMAGLEICTQSLGEIWASPIKWGFKKTQKLKHFLLTYWRHFRGWILPWVWTWLSVHKLMEERLCLPNPPHLLSDFLPSEAQSPHEMPGLRPLAFCSGCHIFVQSSPFPFSYLKK